MYNIDQINELKSKFIHQEGIAKYWLLPGELSGESDHYIYSRQFFERLTQLGIDHQDFVDRYLFGIFSPDDRPRCKHCHKEVPFNWRNLCYNDFCNKYCYNAYEQSDEYRTSMSISVRAAYEDGTVAQKISESHARYWSTHPEARIRRSTALINYWSDPNNEEKLKLHRQHQSEAAKLAYSNMSSDMKSYKSMCLVIAHQQGRIHPGGYTTGSINVVKCSNKSIIHYRSSYEFDYIKKLESDSSVVSYEWEPFAIPYECEGPHHYLPDVLVHYSDRSELQEIKPSSLVDYGMNPIKFAAATEYCKDKPYTFRVVTELDI